MCLPVVSLASDILLLHDASLAAGATAAELEMSTVAIVLAITAVAVALGRIGTALDRIARLLESRKETQ